MPRSSITNNKEDLRKTGFHWKIAFSYLCASDYFSALKKWFHYGQNRENLVQ